MKFTYDGYTGLIELIRKEDYLIADYNNWKQCEKCVILRHDVDTDLQKALYGFGISYTRVSNGY